MDSTTPLDSSQVDAYWRDGYILLEDALSEVQLDALRSDFCDWVEESRDYSKSYGAQIDGRPRFSLEPGHSREQPALRRVASPLEISDACLEVMRHGRGTDAAAQLIGPNLRFNNAKINAKHPGTGTAVSFHQDFLFEPHSNDDLVTVLYFLDDLTPDNGPLEVVPGSHRGALYDHWQDGVFTGAVDSETAARAKASAVPCFGPAGSACLMHTRLLHGSAPNLSDSPRTLYIVEFTAEDAWPLQANHIPSRFQRELVRGVETHRVRCSPYEMTMPEYPGDASFFEQQVRQRSSMPG